MSTVSACRVTLAAGSDDEEHFQKKDKARLARDKLRLNPVVLGEITMLCHLIHSDLHHTNLCWCRHADFQNRTSYMELLSTEHN